MLGISNGFVAESLAVVFIVLLNFVSYEGALRAGLVFDDHLAIENNPVCNSSAIPITTYVYPDAEYQEHGRAKEAPSESTDATEYPVESPHSWKAAWYTDFWGNSFKGDHTHLSYRPITTLTYRFDHWMTNHFSKKSKALRKRKVVITKMKPGDAAAADPELAFTHKYEELNDYHDPYRLHLVNIVLHTINALFFYFYLCRLYLKASRFASIIGASLFAVHPVHVESVTGIVGRAELLCLLFGFIAFHAYFQHHPVAQTLGLLAPETITAPKSTHSFFSTCKVTLSSIIFVLAVIASSLSKETGITVAAICIAYDFILMWRQYALQKEQSSAAKRKTGSLWNLFIPDLFGRRADSDFSGSFRMFAFRVLSLLTIYGYLQGRKILLSGRVDLSESGLIRKVENPFYSLPNGLWRKVSFTYLHAKNLQLLLWPYELCCEYGFDCIPAFTSFADPRVFGILATFGFLAYVGLHCFYIPGIGTLYDIVKGTFQVAVQLFTGSRARLSIFKKKFSIFDIIPEPRLCMASFWLLAPYLPVSHLLVSVGTNIAERCLYIPSVGICLLVTCLLFEIEKVLLRKGSAKTKSLDESPKDASIFKNSSTSRAKGKTRLYYLTQVIVLAVLALGVHKTRERTREWYTDKSLFESAIRVCPRSSKNNNQLGLSRWNEGRIEDGKQLFETAAKLFPEWSEPHFNLARYYYMTQDIRRAFAHLEQCVTGLFPKESCIQMYFSTFSALFPNPNATQLVHTAGILENLQQFGGAASQYRQAGLRFLQGDKSLKGAEYAFQNALRLHESGHITDVEIARRRAQQGEESITTNGDLDSRCNVLYWLGISQMHRHNILGFCTHLHKLIRSCVDDPVDRITALQGLPMLMQQMPMLVESPLNLNKLEKGYGRGIILTIFGQWIDALYLHLQSIPLNTLERAESTAKIVDAVLDMTRLTFTSDELREGTVDATGGPIFEKPADPFFLDEVSHFGTERMYSIEAQRALRDALHTLTEVNLTADGIPEAKEDILVFGSTSRVPRFNAFDYARSTATNQTAVDDRWGTQARKCMLYPALIQTNWRMGDIDEGQEVLRRCQAECVSDASFAPIDDLNGPTSDERANYREMIRMKRAECEKLQTLNPIV
ncbi:hypothetical protein XU18_4000 [Perkinsela sp. CCAP 1560/4]|nr:hypothetical protein XU18_4000 [Perkinsela sp. CCAP 1560/4]|eukprot:KNH04812.1 hypothetical protein XU18_4000 [Perkinsela sp. CCAP 1560/4]